MAAVYHRKHLELNYAMMATTLRSLSGVLFDVTQWRRTEMFKMPYFRNEGHYRSEDLSRDKFLGVLAHGDNKNLEGLANFDFIIF